MPSKFPLAYIDVRTFAHATEDTDKVLKALTNILPADTVNLVTFTKKYLSGHHGNPIILIETRINDRQAALKTFDKIAHELSMLDKEQLARDFESHIEKGNIYLRLDKQAALMGKLRFETGDPIHLKIHFKPSSAQELTAICRQHGLLP